MTVVSRSNLCFSSIARASIQFICWSLVAGVSIWMSAAYLTPMRPHSSNTIYRAIEYADFVGRVLRFHLGIGTAVLLCLALIVRQTKLALASGLLATLLLGPTLWSLLPKSSPPTDGTSARVMTMNLRYDNRDTGAILHRIRESNPDIIAMQEYTQFVDTVLQRELSDYTYRLTDPAVDTSSRGLAIYSKIPMNAKLQHLHNDLGDTNQIRAELQIGGKSVVLFDVHPACPLSIRQVARNQLQVADLLTQLSTETNPIIVAGDFNATETTASAGAIKTFGLTDSHDLAGMGHATTWPDAHWWRYLPGFQIDHVYVGPALTCTRWNVAGATGSDHWPVIADIAMRRAG